MVRLIEDCRLTIFDFTRVCKRWMVAVFAFVAIMTSLCLAIPTPTPAQYIGSVSQASTQLNFSTTSAISAPLAITACSASVTTNCLRMVGQAAHELNLTYSGIGPSGSSCRVLLDGSADGTNWVTIGQAYFPNGSAYGTLTATVFANAYFPLIRVGIVPPTTGGCATLTLSYLGFQNPVPIPANGQNFLSTSVAAGISLGIIPFSAFQPVQGSNLVWYLTSFQCSNPNTSTAWLNIGDGAATGPWFFNVGIPAGDTYQYNGPPQLGYNTLYFAAFTTAAGSTPVSTALVCNAQINYSGPFLPLSPVDYTEF